MHVRLQSAGVAVSRAPCRRLSPSSPPAARSCNRRRRVRSPNSPLPRCAHQAVSYKNYILVFGGEFTSPKQARFLPPPPPPPPHHIHHLTSPLIRPHFPSGEVPPLQGALAPRPLHLGLGAPPAPRRALRPLRPPHVPPQEQARRLWRLLRRRPRDQARAHPPPCSAPRAVVLCARAPVPCAAPRECSPCEQPPHASHHSS